MATIDTLVRDIYELVGAQDHDVIESSRRFFGDKLSEIIATRLFRGDEPGRLRFSNLGSPCERKLWYSVNRPGEGEPLPPEARVKFLFGDILEHLLLFLAAEAGHSVEGMQDRVEIGGIAGSRDAIIDGVMVDVKSASTFAFRKFQNHELETNDPFGYLTQINAYAYASLADPLLTDPSRVAFLAIDKQLGHICLDIYPRSNINYASVVEYKKMIVAGREPPERGFRPVPDGKSGNEKLDTFCSYCDYKRVCHPGLRTFLYSTGPRFLTKVDRLPDVPEAN
jgi:hypothetical protein